MDCKDKYSSDILQIIRIFNDINHIKLIYYKKINLGGFNMTATCIVCEAEIGLPDGCCEGELLICSDCGTELEVISLDPVTVEEAPQVQEDWGE